MSAFIEVSEYSIFLSRYIRTLLQRMFSRFESRKDGLVDRLTKERGKWVRPFIHSGVMGLVFIGVTLGPTIVEKTVQNSDEITPEDIATSTGTVLGASASAYATVETQISEKPRAEIVEYTIQPGDTVGLIASKFGVSEDTVYWENAMTPKTILKPGNTLRILPVTGVKHAVARGETVHSIADKFDASSQAIVDWPFNTFVNDETFELAVGQVLIVPDGVKPDETPISPRQYIARQTPDAGTIAASGVWVWPTAGRITQQFAWYHPGVDIANRDLPVVVAADAGKVVAVINTSVGYGKHVIIDHGNGFQTLYGHLSSFRVEEGQTVNKGAPIGVMGNSGRSTGPHTHFEIRRNGIAINPLPLLQ